MSHVLQPIEAAAKPDFYRILLQQLSVLLEGERDWICNLAQTSAALMASMEEVNWVGFYLFKNHELVLGPFQGRVACTRIALGRGVCGTAAVTRAPVIVPDVSGFPGHIACDARSRSEIVVPLVHGDNLIGVLDLDSPRLNRFDEEDARGLAAITAHLLMASDTAS